MDHGGQLEKSGTIMSKSEGSGTELCDNVPSSEVHPVQTRNLNETNLLTHAESDSPLQNENGPEFEQILKVPLNNNGENKEEEQEADGYKGSDEAKDEEEMDEEMKEEEDESEGSSCLIHCRSPDTFMMDSSNSETGSLLETAYSFSPRMSPELTSPVIPVISAESAYPISPVEQWNPAEAGLNTFNSGSVASIPGTITCTPGPAFTTEPMISTVVIGTSDKKMIITDGTTCVTEASGKEAGISDVVNCGSTCFSGRASSNEEPVTSVAETVTSSVTQLISSSPSSPMSVTTTTMVTFTTRPQASYTASTSTSGSLASVPVPSHTTGPIQESVLLAALEQLAQKGDDTHFPQYLHQIAEAFAHHEDYRLALRCIQLEQLYHQRVLVNLNALQEQWESQCRGASSNLETQHLDTLRDICQMHNRPRTTDVVFASLEFLRATHEEDISLPSCSSAGEMDQSKPAELQGGDLSPAKEKEGDKEGEETVEETTEELGMKDEEEEEEEEEVKQMKRESALSPKPLQVETLVSGTEVEIQHWDNQEYKLCLQQELAEFGDEEEYDVEQYDNRCHNEDATLDEMAKLITVEEVFPALGLVSILKKQNVCADSETISELRPHKPGAKRHVRFKFPDDCFETDVGNGDSCLLLFLLFLVTVVISVGGTALYCALGDAQSSVCQDFTTSAEFYIAQTWRVISQIQYWFTPGS